MSGLVFNAISLLQKETGHFCYNIASPKVAVILKISESNVPGYFFNFFISFATATEFGFSILFNS